MDYIMIHIKDNYKNKIFSQDKMSQFCLIEIDKFIEDIRGSQVSYGFIMYFWRNEIVLYQDTNMPK